MSANDDWRDEAACAGMVSFTEMTPTSQKGVCAHCPVRKECLAYALKIEAKTISPQNHWPVYGGLDGDQRSHILNGNPLPAIQHGSLGGAREHRRRGELPCDTCQVAAIVPRYGVRQTTSTVTTERTVVKVRPC